MFCFVGFFYRLLFITLTRLCVYAYTLEMQNLCKDVIKYLNFKRKMIFFFFFYGEYFGF